MSSVYLLEEKHSLASVFVFRMYIFKKILPKLSNNNQTIMRNKGSKETEFKGDQLRLKPQI